MRATLETIGKAVEAFTVPNMRMPQGGPYAEGEVIGACDAPMLHIRRADGSTFWWRADLCREAPLPFDAATEAHLSAPT